MKTTLFLIALLGLVALSGWSIWSRLPLATVKGQTASAPRQTMPSVLQPARVEGIGYVEPSTEVRRLAFKVGGIIDKCHVAIGQTVQAGDDLMTLANSNEQHAVQVAEQALAMDRADEARVLRGVNDFRIEAARRKVEAVKARIVFLEQEVQRLKTVGSKNVSLTELQRTQASLDEAIADKLSAEAEVQHLAHFVLEEDKQLAAQKVKLAEARLGQAVDLLQNTILEAPFSGTVLEILRREGESVTSDGKEAVILFADTTQLRVRAEVDERYAHLLVKGQDCLVYGRNLGNKQYRGTVGLVKSVMGDKTVFSREATERKDLDTVQVLIDLPPECVLPVGLRVDVSVTIGKKDTTATSIGTEAGDRTSDASAPTGPNAN